MHPNLRYDNLPRRTYASVQAGEFLPTAIIVPGGTGNRIARFLKQRLQSSGAQEIPLLAIDCDSRENEKYPELPALAVPEELVLLKPDVAVRALAKVQERDPSQSHVLAYLPNEIDGETEIHATTKIKIATGNGAGQFRRAGKLVHNANVGPAGADLAARLRRLRSQLIGLASKREKLHTGVRFKDRSKIFVVTSLSGGTGAGSLIDLLALIRLVFPEPSHEVVVVAVLPGEALDRELKNKQEIAVTRANAIATLAEIQAIRTGKALPMTFKFDHEHEVTIRDGANFANEVYLVDNTLSTGNPVGSYLALCGAVAHFIYSVVGTGMGAADSSASVNILDARVVDGQPHNVSTFGVSYLEFPAQPLRRYTVLTAASRWIEEWMKTSAQDSGRQAAEAALIELGLTDADSLRETLHRQLKVESYAILGERRKKLLGFMFTDERFFGEVQRFRNRVQDDLRDYLERVPAIESEARRQRVETVERHFSAVYRASLGDTLDALTELVRRLGALRAALARESDCSTRSRPAMEARFTELEKAIRRNDLPPPFSDRPERNRYLNLLKQRAELDVAEATLPARLAIVQAVEQRATELLRRVETLHADLCRERASIARECDRLRNLSEPDEFGTWAIASRDFPQWAASLTDHLGVSVSLDPGKPDGTAVLEGIVTAVDERVWAGIARIDLADLVRKHESVRHQVQALSEMARPLMQFTPTAPLESELHPMTFLAANLPDQTVGKRFIEEMNPSLRGTTWEPIHTANPHLWICVNVRRGFAVPHWAGFETANRFYLGQRGKAHTLPNWQAVPTLHHTSRDEQEAQSNLGLGLFTEMIRRRGSNYYVNVEKVRNAGSKDRLKYATFAKERGAAGRALVEHGLVEEAMASERMPDDALLGNSLESAVMALRQPVFAETSATIRSTLDELGRTKLGYVELKRQLVAWIDMQLVPEVDKATTRRDLLQSIAARLKAYAETLGKQV